jgi:hypothetical protein
MIQKVWELYMKYNFGSVDRIYVDGTNPSFITSLKLMLGEREDYEKIIEHLKIKESSSLICCYLFICSAIFQIYFSVDLPIQHNNNISTSIPTEYIIDYIRDLQPDIIFISITLLENIKPAERLVQRIHVKYNNKLPVVVGGSAFNKIDQYQDSTINAFVMKNASFDDIMKLVKVSIQ